MSCECVRPDRLQSEDVGDSDKRREYISGSASQRLPASAHTYAFDSFSGIAGAAIVPSSARSGPALLFVNPLYWTQAEEEIPREGWEVRRLGAGKGSGRGDVLAGWVDWIVTVSEPCVLR